MSKVIEEKAEFVCRLKPALVMLPGVAGLQYREFSDKYTEIVKIAWEDGCCDYIDVTADSLEAILQEITRQIRGEKATGLISNSKHKQLIEEWFSSIEKHTDCAWRQ